jgi:flagellar biosynthetic protein FlhB
LPDSGGEKTEKATPKKRKDAREKEGNVLQSKEVGVAVSVLGIFCVMSLLAKYMFQMMMDATKNWIVKAGQPAIFNSEFITENSLGILKYGALILGPILLTAVFFGVIPGIVQTKGLFTMKPLRPKFSRLSPLSGIKRLFSAQSAIGVLKGIVEIAFIILIVYLKIQDLMVDLKKLPEMEVMQGVVYTASNIFSIIMTIVILLVVVAAGDFVFQWWQYEKKLKMSKQELKDEYKQMEGDPQIKARIKQKQREIAQNRMMEEVPDSDVVVRNPTHYAIALKYDREDAMSAPKVVAKGQDIIAQKIIDIAKEHDIYIIEDRPTARQLFDMVDVGREIPAELYNAVAVILTEMYEAKGIKLKEEKKRSLYL